MSRVLLGDVFTERAIKNHRLSRTFCLRSDRDPRSSQGRDSGPHTEDSRDEHAGGVHMGAGERASVHEHLTVGLLLRERRREPPGLRGRERELSQRGGREEERLDGAESSQEQQERRGGHG